MSISEKLQILASFVSTLMHYLRYSQQMMQSVYIAPSECIIVKLKISWEYKSEQKYRSEDHTLECRLGALIV